MNQKMKPLQQKKKKNTFDLHGNLGYSSRHFAKKWAKNGRKMAEQSIYFFADYERPSQDPVFFLSRVAFDGKKL